MDYKATKSDLAEPFSKDPIQIDFLDGTSENDNVSDAQMDLTFYLFYFEKLKSEEELDILHGILFFKENLECGVSNGSLSPPDINLIIQEVFNIILNTNHFEIEIESLQFINNCQFLDDCPFDNEILARLARRCIDFLKRSNEELVLTIIDFIIRLSTINIFFFQEITDIKIFDFLLSVKVARFDDKISYCKKELSFIDFALSRQFCLSREFIFDRFQFYFQYHNAELIDNIFLFLTKYKESVICETHPTLIQLVYDIMLFQMPLEVKKLFNFLNKDDDYFQYFCDFEPQSNFMNLINALIETYLRDSFILIPIFTLINRIPDEFLPSVSNNSQQLLLGMLQVFSIDDYHRRCELYSLILRLFARIIPRDALFLLNGGLLDDLSIFEAVNKQIATDIFDKLVEYITTNEVQEFHQSIEELGSFIQESCDEESIY